jgi:ribosomal protein S1
MPAKKKTGDPDIIPAADENNALLNPENQTETTERDLLLDSVEDTIEKTDDETDELYEGLDFVPDTTANNDLLKSEKQIDTSDVDINELLESMDENETEDTEEINDDINLPEYNDDTDTDQSPYSSVSDDTIRTKPQKVSSKKKETESEDDTDDPIKAPSKDALYVQPMKRRKPGTTPILTIESKAEVETQESMEEAAWHEIRNAYRTRKILTGSLDGVEQTETGKTIAIVNYNDFRVVIPMKEMMIHIGRSPSGQEYTDLMRTQNKIISTMLGAQIDFIVKGIETKTRSIVASRKDAMLKKRQLFYMNTDAAGMYRIYDGRIVQARVIAVAEKIVRIEAFGVECSILAKDLSWDWLGDAHERFSVGDQILVRILSVKRNSLEEISIRADVRSVSENTTFENLKKCRVQSKYAGKVTDVHNGAVYIRLCNGVNAVAHSCYDRRMPGKSDDVSFAITHIDEERCVVLGIITRIIKQNL